jgi:hypothetical protein
MKFYLQPIIRMGCVILIAGSLSLGCADLKKKIGQWQQSSADDSTQTTASDQRIDYFQHTCRWSGETLSDVSLWYTKDVKNWKKLAAANPEVNAKKISLGTKINIPVNLLKTRKPLPKNAVAWQRRHYFHHRVRWAGESLSLISGWYTGSTRNWRKLAAVNPSIHASRIRAGDIILIPPEMLKTRKPLPRKLAARYTPHYFAYTVKHDGEKLSDIAGWYTGNPANWKAVAKANPDLNPDSLAAGNEIYIPSDLLKTRKPIPPAKAVQKPPAPAAKKTPDVEAPIKLFGPKRVPKG